MLKKVILPAALTGLMLAGPVIALADMKHSDMKMSMTQALEKVDAAGYKNIHEIERKRDHYHVEVYNQNCHKHHLKVLANGKVEKGHSHERHPTSYDRVPASTIAAKVKNMGYTKIKEIDLDFDHYHVKAVDQEGHSKHLSFDAITGKQKK